MEKKKEKILDLKSSRRERFTDLITPKRLNLKCPECNHDIGGEDINIVKAIAKCNNCGALMTLEDNSLYPGRRRPEVYMPRGIEMLRLRDELNIDISWRKNGKNNAFLTLFAFIWNAVILPVAFFAILSGEFHMLIFMSLHLAVGIGMIYYLLTSFINTTYITVNDYRIHIEHRPLKVPFYPDKDINIDDIKQLFVDKYVSSTTNGNKNYSYALSAVLRNGRRVKLLKGMQDAQQAQYIEQEVEAFLDIPDEEVKGEWLD
ncbi:MAG: hypothetical protein AAGG75_06985 [Bacteroidota bacterium]